MENRITGNRLIRLGYTPAPWFKSCLEHLNSVYTDKDSIIIEVAEYYKKQYEDSLPKVEPLKEGVNYAIYYTPISGNEYDKDNLNKVLETMDEVMKHPRVVDGAILPDACPSGDVGTIPVGGMVTLESAICPDMHSADICCSVMSTDLGRVPMISVMMSLKRFVHFGKGGREDFLASEVLGSKVTDIISKFDKNNFTKGMGDKVVTHLGTCGDGNHFVFVGVSRATGNTVLVTHFGSRGVGAEVYKRGKNVAKKISSIIAPDLKGKNAYIPYESQEGQDYLEALYLVKEWTKLNHETVHTKVMRDLGINVSRPTVWTIHNFVQGITDSDGNPYFNHLKGAINLQFPSEIGLIPLNMASPILVVRKGFDCLGLAPHGAGRLVSRRKFKEDFGEDLRLFDKLNGLDINFFHGYPDFSELPQAYKDPSHIIKSIKEHNLVEVIDTIEPYGCIMAGEVKEI